MLGETILIQVEEKGENQPAAEGESEQMKDLDPSQQIEDLTEVADMELESELRDEDVDLIPSPP